MKSNKNKIGGRFEIESVESRKERKEYIVDIGRNLYDDYLQACYGISKLNFKYRNND